MQGSRTGLIVAAVFLCVFAASYGFLQFRGYLNPAPAQGDVTASIPAATPIPTPVPMPAPVPIEPAGGAAPPPSAAPEPTPIDITAIEPGAGVPATGSADPAGGSVLPPPSGAFGGAPPPSYALPPAAHDPSPSPPSPPSAMPPAGHDPLPTAMPPAGAADPPAVNTGRANKVLSYFQHTRTRIDTRNAFGFVLLPRAAVTSDERDVQKQFCEIMLATMDFMTPGAAAGRTDILVTYWPIVASRESFEIKAAFDDRDCGLLLTWYDHKLARSLATKAGVAGLSGPLLITWPSSGVDGEEARNPLIVDFSKADHERATKVLQYWFRQLRTSPQLWTSRIREGTIRAELADAVNDTAGVVLAVLHGKWDSLNTVSATP